MSNMYKDANSKIQIYSDQDLACMKKPCKLAADTLEYLEQHIQVGVTTLEIDKLCEDFVKERGGKLTCKGYQGFPGSLCTSVNEVACHGVPNERKLQDGDIINIDVVVEVDGWHGDTSRTVAVGNVKEQHKQLIQIAKEAMHKGIDAVRVGATFNDIAIVIDDYVKKQNGFNIIPEFCGHGIGRSMHEEPLVLHFPIKEKTAIIQPGMFFTIEPIISCGDIRTRKLRDGWTMITRDRSFAAQFEHTIAVDSTGKVHILT